jgi:HEAT repeat protein
MKRGFFGGVPIAALVLLLTACGNRETSDALKKAAALSDQKQYQEADDVLVAALRARESEIRAHLPTPSDELGVDELTKKVQADPEILKMERAQIPIYLHLERPDLASAVYADILGGSPNDSVVFDTLQDKDATIRTGAVRVLGLAGQPGAIESLAEATKDSDRDVRRAAVAALGTIKDPKTVPPLINALTDSYWFVRSDAADALGHENDSRAIEPLLKLVDDPDSTVESSAENALVLLASEKKAPADVLLPHLNDTDQKTVTICAVCLAVGKDPRATPTLLKMAVSPDAATRLHAVKALGETGDAKVIPALRQTLQDTDTNVRGWSIIGLGKLDDLDSVPALRAIAADTNQPASIRNAATAAADHITGTPTQSASGAP